MNFIVIFFIFVRIFHFLYAHRIAYLMQKISEIIDNRRNNPQQKQIVVIDFSVSVFIIYAVLDILFLFYCVWLMFEDTTWTPGFLLLIVASIESLAVHARISGTYFMDHQGFVYPRTWFRLLTFIESILLLLKLIK